MSDPFNGLPALAGNDNLFGDTGGGLDDSINNGNGLDVGLLADYSYLADDLLLDFDANNE